jgi:prepilin-type N-terminal cleavage/methylation domain-containing protein
MRKAFTLVELLIVIAIIAILAAIAIPQYTKYVKKAAVSNAQAQLSACVSAAMAAYADNGTDNYTCNLDLGGNKTGYFRFDIDDNGTLSLNTTTYGNVTVEDTDTIKIKIKGQTITCDYNKNTNTFKCK